MARLSGEDLVGTGVVRAGVNHQETITGNEYEHLGLECVASSDRPGLEIIWYKDQVS